MSPLRTLGLASLIALSACTSLKSVSLTQIPQDRSRPVRAEVNNTAFLGVHFSNDFVDAVTPSLMKQCPNGKLTGLLTKQENTTYFLVSTRTVVVTGYCVYDPIAKADPSPVVIPPPAASKGGV